MRFIVNNYAPRRISGEHIVAALFIHPSVFPSFVLSIYAHINSEGSPLFYVIIKNIIFHVHRAVAMISHPIRWWMAPWSRRQPCHPPEWSVYRLVYIPSPRITYSLSIISYCVTSIGIKLTSLSTTIKVCTSCTLSRDLHLV